MNNSKFAPYLKLAALSLVGMAVHYYILSVLLPDAQFLIPIWTIYLFNAVLVGVIIGIIQHYAAKKSQQIFYIFLAYTIVKMLLAVVFLLPLFVNESTHETVEVANFFIPYFAFLTFEVFTLFNFLKKT